MGMYTEICVAVELRKDTPQQVTDTVKWLAGDPEFPWDKPPALPSHRAFSDAERISVVLLCGSYYFAANKSHTTFYFDGISKTWRLIARANLKNYGDEIGMFLEWLGPYIMPNDEDDNGWQFIGHTRYEEDQYPTLVFVNKAGEIRYIPFTMPTSVTSPKGVR